MPFTFPPRVSLAHLPTPVHHLPRLSHSLGGPDIYLKRDDLTGFALSGNKVRKLEFVIV
ncbi:MAG: D-cysteine desulfhydrase family protein, partial [Calditrichaeota bacterium]|nr:D-cysteine desulfhydrase family protein [Calditrichota bacterium]